MVQPCPDSHLLFDIGQHLPNDILPAGEQVRLTENAAVSIGQYPRIMVDRTSNHDAIDLLQMLSGLIQRHDAAVDDNLKIGKILLDPVDSLILQRRLVTILFGAEALQPGLAGMDNKAVASALGDNTDKITQL